MVINQLADDVLVVYQLACEKEPWKRDHDNAMECYELERFVDWGNTIFAQFSKFDVDWHIMVNSGRIEYTEADEKRIEALYRGWLQTGEKLLLVIKQYEDMGFKVRGAQEFRSDCMKARSIFIPDDQFFQGEKLAALRDEAIKDYRDGRTTCHESGPDQEFQDLEIQGNAG